jgi:predicted Zn-dependent protease
MWQSGNLNRELTKLANFLRHSLPKAVQGHRSVKSALAMSDEQLYAWAGIACKMAEQGNCDEARDILEGLAVIDPDNAYIHSCLGTLYMRLNEKDLAAGEFIVTLAKDPADRVAAVNLGELYLESGNQTEAKKYLEMTIELANNPADYFSQRADTLLKKLRQKQG